MLSSPCSVIIQGLCYRFPALSSSKVCAIVSLLCHHPKFVLSSPCSVISQFVLSAPCSVISQFVLSSPCSVISQTLCCRLPALSSASLCYRLPAQSSAKVGALVSLLCHHPQGVLSSPHSALFSIIIPLLCHRPLLYYRYLAFSSSITTSSRFGNESNRQRRFPSVCVCY